MNNVHPIFDQVLAPFNPSRFTTEQRMRVSEAVQAIADANRDILEIALELEEKQQYEVAKHTEKIGAGITGLFNLVK